MKKTPWNRYNKLVIDIKQANLPRIVKDGLFDKMKRMSAAEAVDTIGQEFRQALNKHKKW